MAKDIEVKKYEVLVNGKTESEFYEISSSPEDPTKNWKLHLTPEQVIELENALEQI